MNRESVESFIARGGPIIRLANGVMRDADRTSRERINPDLHITNAERKARKLAAQAIPVPNSRIGRERGVSKPKKSGKAGKPGPESKRHARKNAILALLAEGPVSLQFIAGALAIDGNQVSVYLRRLKLEGRVVSYGDTDRLRRWGLA